MKMSAATRQFDKIVCRGISAGEAAVQFFELLHDVVGAERVHVSERAAAKWRESKSINRPDITISSGFCDYPEGFNPATFTN